MARVELPPKLLPVFAKPRGSYVYRGAYGGRGSGKSFSFAKMAAIWGMIEPLKILCCREIQESIKDSFHAELKRAIASEPWLAAFYDVGENYIRAANGTEFIFKGLRHNISTVKSLANIGLCIVEEAEDVPEHSWEALDPTIREQNSEMWVIWNPKKKGSPVDKRFRQHQDASMNIVEMNYRDNPWFKESVLDFKRQRDKEIMDADKYNWIWEGDYYENSEELVFHNKFIVDTFEIHPSFFNGPYDGLDFGFSNDPTAATCSWVKDNILYIPEDASKLKLELDQTTEYLQSEIPGLGKRARLIADNARPESISYLKRHGMPRIEPTVKGKGSVEDGIEHLKSYKVIVIHPKAVNTKKEMGEYSYKIDKLTGEITRVIVDANNHNIDALRYGQEPLMKKAYFDNYEGLMG